MESHPSEYSGIPPLFNRIALADKLHKNKERCGEEGGRWIRVSNLENLVLFQKTIIFNDYVPLIHFTFATEYHLFSGGGIAKILR